MATKKPTMAPKAFEFKFWKADAADIPTVARGGGGVRIPVPFSDMWDSDVNATLVPPEFWTLHGIGADLANDPVSRREALKRNFSAWKKEDEKNRANIRMALSDQMNKNQKFIGTNVYLRAATPAEIETADRLRKAAANRSKPAATTGKTKKAA
jgi:hypothetical protein